MATQIQRTLERSLMEDGASAVELMKTRKFWMSPELAELYDYNAGMPTNSLREQFDAIAAKPSCTRLFAIASRCAAHSRSAVSYPGFATLPE